MRVYVASKFDNQGAVRAAIAALEKDGHEIALDWTVFDEGKLVAEAKPVAGATEQPPWTIEAQRRLEQFRSYCAKADVDAVKAADAFILLMVPEMRGAWVELGVAISQQAPGLFNRAKRIIVVGRTPELDTVFLHMRFIEHYETFDEARKALNTQPRPMS